MLGGNYSHDKAPQKRQQHLLTKKLSPSTCFSQEGYWTAELCVFLPQTGLGCFHGYNSVRNKEQLNVEKTGDNFDMINNSYRAWNWGLHCFFQERAEVGARIILAVDHWFLRELQQKQRSFFYDPAQSASFRLHTKCCYNLCGPDSQSSWAKSHKIRPSCIIMWSKSDPFPDRFLGCVHCSLA